MFACIFVLNIIGMMGYSAKKKHRCVKDKKSIISHPLLNNLLLIKIIFYKEVNVKRLKWGIFNVDVLTLHCVSLVLSI